MKMTHYYQEFTATEEAYYAGAVNWNFLFSSEISQRILDREQDRVYKLHYRPMFLDKSGKQRMKNCTNIKEDYLT